MIDWSKLPDLAAVGLFTSAFASVAQKGKPASSRLWLIGWAMVMLHFIAYAFLDVPGHWGDLVNFFGTAALAWAGMLFMWASVPYRKEASSFAIFCAIVASSAFYIAILVFGPGPSGLLVLAAVTMGVSPLGIALLNLSKFYHPLRWAVTSLFLAASVFILAMQHRPNGLSLGLNGLLFAIYIGCAIHFWYRFPRATAGAFITIAGFFAWASVFVLGPITLYVFPNVHAENEVWNLPMLPSDILQVCHFRSAYGSAKIQTAPPSGTSGYSPGNTRFRLACTPRESPPQPAWTAMYCLPSMVKEVGASGCLNWWETPTEACRCSRRTHASCDRWCRPRTPRRRRLPAWSPSLGSWHNRASIPACRCLRSRPGLRRSDRRPGRRSSARSLLP